MALIHQECPRMEAQLSPLCENFVHWLVCRVWKVAPKESFHVDSFGGDGGIQLGNLLGAESVMLPQVEISQGLTGNHVSELQFQVTHH